MAEATDVAATAAKAPSASDIERASEFSREPFLLEGEDAKALIPPSARRQAFEDALTEIEGGAKGPSTDWRRQYSLLLGLERLLSEDPPHLSDGAELNPHSACLASALPTKAMILAPYFCETCLL